MVEYGKSYAVQTYSDIPKADGRRIQIGWIQGDMPEMPFSQQMSFPCELTLRSSEDGPRLYKYPAKEIEKLYGASHAFEAFVLDPGSDPLADLIGDAFDIEIDFELGNVSEVGFSFCGSVIKYVADDEMLCGPAGQAPLVPEQGRIKLRVLADRASIEVFGNGGRVAISSPRVPTAGERDIRLYCTGGSTRIVSLTVHELQSAWDAPLGESGGLPTSSE